MSIDREQEKEWLTQNLGALIIIRGIPGSGKSTLASRLAQNLGEKVLKIDPDEYRYKTLLQFSPYPVNRDELFNKLTGQALEALRLGKIVIWDQALTSLDEDLVKRIESIIQPIPLLLVEIEISESVAWSRVQQRDAEGLQTGPDIETFNTLCKRYSSFRETNSGTNIIRIQGDNPLEDNIKQIIDTLKEVYSLNKRL